MKRLYIKYAKISPNNFIALINRAYSIKQHKKTFSINAVEYHAFNISGYIK